MIKVDLTWLQNVLKVKGQKCSKTESKLSIANINTDSRTIQSGEVFVALSGPNFKGNKFVAEVKAKGAIAAVVSELQDVDLPQFVVEDTKLALGQLGAAVKADVAPKTIAITGSVGKTSVKEMSLAILQQAADRPEQVLATNGNFNNDIGAPLTLLRLEPQHQFAVIELGANHIGEIDYTVNLTKPDVSILNNVAEAHLEGFGGLQGVVKAKGEIFNSLTAKGIAILNGDSEHKQAWLPALNAKLESPDKQIIQFSSDVSNKEKIGFITSDNVQLDETGCAKFDLNYAGETHVIQLTVPGKHNVKNALAATAASLSVGASMDDVIAGLASMNAVKGRVNLHPVNENLLVIDDTYNANVQSVKAAIELVTSYVGKSILVLGDMAELGDEADALHREVGEFAKSQDVDVVFTCGDLSEQTSLAFGEQGQHYSEQAQTYQALSSIIKSNSEKINVLVKGSRSAKMENIVAQLSSEFNQRV